MMRWMLVLLGFPLACHSVSNPTKEPLSVSLGGSPPTQRWTDPLAAAEPAALGNGSRLLMNEAVAPGDRLTARAQVPGRSCMLLVGRTSPGLRDVDLLLFAEDGT